MHQKVQFIVFLVTYIDNLKVFKLTGAVKPVLRPPLNNHHLLEPANFEHQ